MEVVKEYIDYIKDKKRLSNNTVSSYYIDIKKYINYLNSINLELNDVVENDIIGYIINLEKENVSVATVSRMISSIKSFHDYLFLNHIINNNPAKTMATMAAIATLRAYNSFFLIFISHTPTNRISFHLITPANSYFPA